jgi:predicted dehydrogenase/NAD(P)-dependent dehydrogenase (short-subunit alcohol dehydrogenase family)
MTNPSAPRVTLITGPTSGLGRAIALQLAKHGHQLALFGRNAAKLESVSNECVALGAPTPVTLVADMTSQADVRRAAAEFLETGLPLHVLLHNAGMVNQHRQLTVDGIEATFSVHYASAFLLTRLLVEKLIESKPAMIIHTTSEIYPLGKLKFDDVRAEKGFYNFIGSYAASKIALVSLTKMLSERLSPHGVSVNVYNPGMNYTNIVLSSNSGKLGKAVDFIWRRVAAPVEAGITIPVELATMPDLSAVTGHLYMHGKRAEMTERATDPVFSSALWALSEELTDTHWPAELGPPQPQRLPGTVRFGALGAARITPFSLFKQAPKVKGVEVAAVAEEYQSYEATLAYAKKHGIPEVHRRFDAILADPAIDAIYLALPTSMHADLALACIASGKHLLCEKPLACNAREARRLDAAGAQSGLVVAEAMHSLLHPLVVRLRSLLADGEIGELQRVEIGMSAYIPKRDFRFVYELGGGAMLDMGCYPVAFLRSVLGTEPTVTKARADLVAPKVDGTMQATLAFPNAPDVRMFVSMRSFRRPLEVRARFVGTSGRADLLNFVKPEVYHRLVVRNRSGRRVERVPGGSTYRSQLEAFVASIRDGAPVLTTTADAVRTLTVIDAIYERAGLPPRGLP